MLKLSVRPLKRRGDNSCANRSVPLTGTVRPKQRATLGASAGSCFKGAIDDIQIFSRALTGEEIRFLYDGEYAASGVDTRRQLPRQSRLELNYPNPFNPATTFRYALAERGKVRLALYDILGREVAQLVDAIQEPGAYEVHWRACGRDGRPLSSGVYFYRLTTQGYEATGKMSFLK